MLVLGAEYGCVLLHPVRASPIVAAAMTRIVDMSAPFSGRDNADCGELRRRRSG
jgi:hypothetical protein